MSVFICSKCGMMENTATSHYWIRPKDSPPLCVLCDPAIGKWHNCFDRKPIPTDCVVGPDGFIYHKDDSYLKKQLEEEKKKGKR